MNGGGIITLSDILSTMDKRRWKKTIEIAYELNMDSFDLLSILLLGKDRVFALKEPDKWKICKNATNNRISFFLNEIANGAKSDDAVISKYIHRKYNIKKIKQNDNKLFKKERVKRKSSQVIIISHCQSYGKKNLYNGPRNQYWTDPSFKKKEL